jgi:outer membrane biosynthesis protein TonB
MPDSTTTSKQAAAAVLAKFEPNPAASKDTKEANGAVIAAPAVAVAEPPVLATETVIKPADKPKVAKKTKATKPKAPKAKPVKVAKPAPKTKAQEKPRRKYLIDLGAGYGVSGKKGSGYEVFLKTVAEKGHFADLAADLEANKVDASKKEQAEELLAKAFVPVNKLEEWCRKDHDWKQHAAKKTEKSSKSVLANEARANNGKWTGSINEMISTYIGYYNSVYGDKKNKKAKEGPSFVMMFPVKFADTFRTAIVTAKGVNEDVKNKKS